jgi:hypothetical protein
MKKLLASLMLVLALGLPALAGDTNTPPLPPPPPPCREDCEGSGLRATPSPIKTQILIAVVRLLART